MYKLINSILEANSSGDAAVRVAVARFLADAARDGIDIGDYASRLNEDGVRIMEFVAIAFDCSPEKEAMQAEYEGELGALLVKWTTRLGELLENPARMIRADGKNPFDGERKATKAFIEKWNLPVSFRDALKHW